MVTKVPKKAAAPAKKSNARKAAAPAKSVKTSMKDSAQQLLTAAEGKFDTLSNKAGQQWDKLEAIFEERVAKALKRLGVPSGVELGYFVSKHVQLGAGLFFLRNHFHDGPSSQRN